MCGMRPSGRAVCWLGGIPVRTVCGQEVARAEHCVEWAVSQGSSVWMRRYPTVSLCGRKYAGWRSLWARWDLGVAQYAEWEVSLEELRVQKGGISEQRGVLVGNVPVEQCGAGNSPWYSSVWSRMYSGRGGVWCGKSRTYIQWKCLGWGVSWVSAVGKPPLYSTV